MKRRTATTRPSGSFPRPPAKPGKSRAACAIRHRAGRQTATISLLSGSRKKTEGTTHPQWSPDGKMISFSNGATAEELAKQKDTLPVPAPAAAAQPAASPKPSPERESDVRVIKRAVYGANDAGYLEYEHR